MAIYECKYCPRKFRFKVKLQEHVTKFHKDKFTEEDLGYLKAQLKKKKKKNKNHKPPIPAKKKKVISKKEKSKFTKIIYTGLPETNRRKH